MRKEHWKRAETKRECRVCQDAMGFHARACPGCGRRKLRLPSGMVIGVRPEMAEIVTGLQARWDKAQEELARGG